MTAIELFERVRQEGLITATGRRVMVTLEQLEDLENAAYENGREDGHAAGRAEAIDELTGPPPEPQPCYRFTKDIGTPNDRCLRGMGCANLHTKPWTSAGCPDAVTSSA